MDRRAIHWCLLIFLIALAPRLLLVAEVLGQASEVAPATPAGGLPFMTPDSPAYLQPAKGILNGDLLDGGGLVRPPGYPIFLALFGANLPAALAAQAILGSLLPVVTLLLVKTLTGSLGLSLGAALLSALLPTGVGVTALIMADLLLAVLMGVGLLLLALAAKHRSTGPIPWAGVVFGLATLVKPIAVFWAPVSVGLLWLFGGGSLEFLRWRVVVLLVGLQLLPIAAWTARNYAREGMPSFSTIGKNTVRVYWLARAQLRATMNTEPAPQQIHSYQEELRNRLFEPNHSPDRVSRRVRSESLRILRRHPVEAATTYLVNLDENTSEGWDRFENQLPRSPSLANALTRISDLEGRLHGIFRWFLLLGPVGVWLLVRSRPGPTWKTRFFQVVGLSLAASYFVLLSGITFWTGPRIIYPAQIAVLSMLATIASVFAGRFGLRRSDG